MQSLDRYTSGYKIPIFRTLIWMFFSRIFFESFIPYPSSIKVLLLRIFGARMGKGIVIKPNVKIKYPWNITVGDFSWIGEYVWIDNLAHVSIKDNCCISQGAYILTGNHDYKSSNFQLRIDSVQLSTGVWVGAKSVVCPGVKMNSYSILTVGSVAVGELKAKGIYKGNPAVKIKDRKIEY